jgi:hypothetical protein
MGLSQYTTDYVLARRDALVAMHHGRNERMNLYERMYRMDMWNESASENEHRVTLPIAHDTVEKMRALLVTRPPIISVPYPSSAPDRQEQAQKKESFLYGVLSMANFMQALSDAEWYADCFGWTDVKCVYDRNAYEDEAPIIIQAPDPRSLYGARSPRKDRYTELVQQWKRSRREIESETGKSLPRPDGLDLEQVEGWLDDEVNYIEYWRETQGWEKAEPAAPPEPTMIDRAADVFLTAMSGEEVPAPPSAEIEAEEPERKRVRHIIHCILVEDALNQMERAVWIKKPLVVPGYHMIPFFGWAGIDTPLPGKNAGLSVLFPLSNGDCVDAGGEKAMGLLATWNWIMTLNVQAAIDAANSPWDTDDPDATVDLSPDAINRHKPGSKITKMNTGNVNPGSMQMAEVLNQQIARVSIPSIFEGTPTNLSGQAISGFATVFQMLVGMKQHGRENALSKLCTHVLNIAREYAEEPWTVWGYSPTGQYFEERFGSADVGDDTRVTVKLSASMPKDDIGTVSMFSTLQTKGQISLETLLDQVQKLFGLAADTVDDEMKRIARDAIMSNGEIAKAISLFFANDYVAQLTGTQGGVSSEEIARSIILKIAAEAGAGQQQQQQQQPAQSGAVPPGAAPTGGLPPSAVPPTPEAVGGAGDITAMQNMLAQQQTMPGAMPGGMQQ